MTGRRRMVRALRTVAALGAAAALTITLAQDPASGAFTGVTGSSGNSATAAANFCTTTGTTLTASDDSWVESGSPTPNGGSASLNVRSATSTNQRALVRFPLPTVPVGCTISSAVLQLYNAPPTAGRTIDVYRGDPSAPLWAESTVVWTNQPPTAGTAASSVTVSTSGWQTWTVTNHVLAHYATANNGFIVRDSVESDSGTSAQRYISREGVLPPQLVLAWS